MIPSTPSNSKNNTTEIIAPESPRLAMAKLASKQRVCNCCYKEHLVRRRRGSGCGPEMFLRRSPSTEELKGAALRRMSRIYSEGRLPSTQRKLFLERIGNHYDNAAYLHQVLHDLGEFEESRPPILIRAVELAASYKEEDSSDEPSKAQVMRTPKQQEQYRKEMSRRSPWDKCYRAVRIPDVGAQSATHTHTLSLTHTHTQTHQVRQCLRDEFGEFAFAAHETHIKLVIKAVAGTSSSSPSIPSPLPSPLPSPVPSPLPSSSSSSSSKTKTKTKSMGKDSKDEESSHHSPTTDSDSSPAPEVIPVSVKMTSYDLRRVAQEQRRMSLDKTITLTASPDNISFVGWWGKKKPRNDKFQDRIFVIQQGMLAYFESTARAIELKPQKKPLRLNALLDVQSPSTNKATLNEAWRRRVSGLKNGRRGSDPSDDVVTCDLVFSLSNGLKKFHLVGPSPSHPSLERRKAREMVNVLRAIAHANDAANHSKSISKQDTTKELDVLMKRRASLLKRASSVVSKPITKNNVVVEEHLGTLSVMTRTRDPKPVDVDEDWDENSHWTDDLDFGESGDEEELEEKEEEKETEEEKYISCDFAIRGHRLGCTPIESECSDIPKRVMDLRYCEFHSERDAESRLVRVFSLSLSLSFFLIHTHIHRYKFKL